MIFSLFLLVLLWLALILFVHKFPSLILFICSLFKKLFTRTDKKVHADHKHKMDSRQLSEYNTSTDNSLNQSAKKIEVNSLNIRIEKKKDLEQQTIQNLLREESILPIDIIKERNQAFAETGEYANKIQSLNNPTLQDILQISKREVNHWQREIQDRVKEEIENGVAILHTDEQLKMYIYSFSNMHIAKLDCAFDMFLNELLNIGNTLANVNIVIDWGCGQALASSYFIDYLRMHNLNCFNINKFLLIEPSNEALQRGVLHLTKLFETYNCCSIIKTINKTLDDITFDDIYTFDKYIKIHFFSNVLDIESYDENLLIEKIKQAQKGTNYFVCVSPYITEVRADRVRSFSRYFCQYDTYDPLGEDSNRKVDNEYWKCNKKYTTNDYCDRHINTNNCGCPNKWTRIVRVFKVEL